MTFGIMQIWIQLIFKTMSVASSHDAMGGFQRNYSALKSIGTHQHFTHLVVVLGHVFWLSHTSLFTYDVSRFRPVVPLVFPATLIMRHALIPATCLVSPSSPEYSFCVSFPGPVCHCSSVLLLPALISCVWNLSPVLILCPPWGLALHLDLFC